MKVSNILTQAQIFNKQKSFNNCQKEKFNTTPSENIQKIDSYKIDLKQLSEKIADSLLFKLD